MRLFLSIPPLKQRGSRHVVGDKNRNMGVYVECLWVECSGSYEMPTLPSCSNFEIEILDRVQDGATKQIEILSNKLKRRRR